MKNAFATRSSLVVLFWASIFTILASQRMVSARDEMEMMESADETAFGKIESELMAAARYRKTLAVWIIDQDAEKLLKRHSARIAEMLKGGNTPAKIAALKNLEAALVTFSDGVDVVTQEPTRDEEKIKTSLRSIASQSGTNKSAPGKLAYAAIDKAADAFLSYRDKDYEVIFVLIAADAVADEDSLAKVVTRLKRASIPVYSFGPPQPMYVQMPKIAPGVPFGATWRMEHLTLYTPAKINDKSYADSGYGKLGLERICKLTSGKFFCTHSEKMSAGWQLTSTDDIPADVLRKYLPDLVSEAEYLKMIEGNKACKALLEASRMVIDARFEPPRMAFEAGKGDQARFTKDLTNAQQKAAKPEDDIRKIYQRLAEGEADRAQLKSPRWQAAYDLAMGRVAAAYARTRGYNKMVAQLKSGKVFTDASHTMWELVPSDNFSGDSELNTLAKKSREYLNRVKDEHPYTPWGDIAVSELAFQPGWDWEEK
jgi:hypothetical protein